MAKAYTKEQWDALSNRQKKRIEKKQLFLHLDEAGVEATKVLLGRIVDGEIDGSLYWSSDSQCGCLLGTLTYAKMPNCNTADIEGEAGTENWKSAKYMCINEGGYYGWSDNEWGVGHGTTIAENMVFNLRPGDTPENNKTAKTLHRWIAEWLDKQSVTA